MFENDLEVVHFSHESESHVSDLLGVLFTIRIGQTTRHQVAITNYLNLVHIKHVNSIVKDVVEIIEELDGLAGGAHGGQLGEAHDVTEEECCALIQLGRGLFSSLDQSEVRIVSTNQRQALP